MHLHQNILQCVMEEGIPVTRVSMTEVTSVEEGEVSLQINNLNERLLVYFLEEHFYIFWRNIFIFFGGTFLYF